MSGRWILAPFTGKYGEGLSPQSLYFYRDRDKKEIDLVIDQDNKLYPMEIKKTASPRKEMVRHFKLLDRSGRDIGPGGLLCMVKTCLPVTRDVNAIPVGWI